MKKLTILLLAVFTLFASCRKDDDNEPVNTSRTLQYNLTGNFSGSSLIVSFTTATGGTSNEPINILPWNKEVTYNANVTAANIAVSGNGGTPGQKVTLIIKRGGVDVGAPIVATADASGSFTKAAPAVVF